MAQVGVAPSSRARTARPTAVLLNWERERAKREVEVSEWNGDVNGLTLPLSTLDSAQDRTGQTVDSTDDNYNP